MSNTIFHTIPMDASINAVLPKLNAAETGRFSWVSKHTQEIVSQAANNQHNDITLEGKCETIVPGTITAFLHVKLRNDIFANFSRLMTLKGAIATIQTNSCTSLDITSYIQLAKHNIDTYGSNELLSAIVPFDFDKKQISAQGSHGLANVLLNAIKQKSPELIRGILAHPNAKDIPVEGLFSLRTALAYAIETGNPEVIRAVLAHSKIPGDGSSGLMDSLSEVVREEMPVELVGSFLSHPNASDIESNSLYTLIRIFELAVDENKTAYAEAILISPKFLVDGKAHLGMALYYAVFNKNIPLMKLILKNPRAKNLPVDGNGGLRSTVRCAVGHIRDEPDLLSIVLSHPNIPANGEWGLGDLLILCVANKDLPADLIDTILAHPNAENISANDERYGVQQALSSASFSQRNELKLLISSRFKV